MIRIALIGAKGFVGSALYKELKKNATNKIASVTRDNYLYWKTKEFDIVINSAMPSARFWANQNPYQDFIETVQKTAGIVYEWKYKKLIQISTLSARTELDSVYGRNKASAENLCSFGENLVVRLTSMYGDTLKKGALIDLLNNQRIYVSGRSRYSFASLEFICKWISQNLDKKGVIEVGAKNSVSLNEIASFLKVRVIFEGRTDVQEVQHPLPEFPDAKLVLNYLKHRAEKNNE